MVWKSFSQEELLEKQKFRVGLGCSSQILNTEAKLCLWEPLSAGQPGSCEKRGGDMNKNRLKKKKRQKKMVTNL